MNIIKLRLAITMTGLAGALAIPSLFAQPYYGLDGTINFAASTYQFSDGGEFNVVTTPYGGLLDLGNFATFCIETSEFIGQPPSGPYTYTINLGAVMGDGGANSTDPHTGLAMDNISIGTAWLYSQFRAGTLTDTSGGGSGSYFSDGNRLNNAGELQQAIWYLEDENGGQNNAYVTMAETTLGLNLDGVEADSNGAYDVVALNLFDSSGNLAQDQLAIDPNFTTSVPEPPPVALLTLAMSAWIALRSRSLRRKSKISLYAK